ncbi:hypothetical protein MP228_008884 [Amoeboaphelidium protococcarum]|nr:hypothetical protein MP228_008884 [Amoeboaphelidium protococcarum]
MEDSEKQSQDSLFSPVNQAEDNVDVVEDTVECPACQLPINAQSINAHLDNDCIRTKEEEEESVEVSAIKVKPRLSKLQGLKDQVKELAVGPQSRPTSDALFEVVRKDTGQSPSKGVVQLFEVQEQSVMQNQEDSIPDQLNLNTSTQQKQEQSKASALDFSSEVVNPYDAESSVPQSYASQSPQKQRLSNQIQRQNIPGLQIVRSAALLPNETANTSVSDDPVDVADQQFSINFSGAQNGGTTQQFRYIRAFSNDDLHAFDVNTIDKQFIALRMQEHPSNFVQVYDEGRAKDVATQTKEKQIQPKKGGLALPSERMGVNPLFGEMDILESSLDDFQAALPEGLEHSHLGRKDIASRLGLSADSLRVRNGKVLVESKDALNENQQPSPKKRRAFVIENKRAQMSDAKRRYYEFGQRWRVFWKDAEQLIQLWNKPIKYVESRFGTGIVSYFRLYRWLYLVNVLFGVVWYFFVILFGVLYQAQQKNAGFEITRQKLTKDGQFDINLFFIDLFSGGSSLNNTIMFEVGYPAKIYFANDGNSPSPEDVPYNMDIAYLAVIFFTYIMSFALILIRMKSLFVEKAEVSSGVVIDDYAPFGTAVFASWDFAIASAESRKNHNFAISTLFKTLIAKLEIAEQKQNQSSGYKVENIVRRFFGNIFVIAIWCLSGFVVYITLNLEYNPNGLDTLGILVTPETFGLVRSNRFISITAFLISSLNLILPSIFKLIARFERYDSPTVAATITLTRAYVTKIAAVYVIVVSLYIANRFKLDGWEYAVGQNFYQLVWTNFAFSTVSTVFYGVLYRQIFGKQYYDFGLAENILEVIYQQALVLIGVVYSPAVVVLSLLLGGITFYVKYLTLCYCGLPPRRVYNSYFQNIYFLMFLVLTLLLMAFPTFFSLTQFPPTSGPYSFAQQNNVTLSSIYSVIPNGVASMKSDFLRNLIQFIGSVGFIGPLIGVLVLTSYFLSAINEKRQKKLKKISLELRSERADKKFLLKYYRAKN